MSNIIRPDQYIDHYIYEKETNPDAQIVVRAFQRKMVEQVDRIVELAHGQRDFVTSESDWRVVEELFAFFAKEWPQEYTEFKSAMSDIRRLKGVGYSKDKEILHTGSIPPRLMKMVKAIFPAQQWDKTFVNKLVRKYPLFKVGEA